MTSCASRRLVDACTIMMVMVEVSVLVRLVDWFVDVIVLLIVIDGDDVLGVKKVVKDV